MGHYLPYVFLLACPLMMIVMMLGFGHGHGRHAEHGGGEPASLDELRRRRDDFDSVIATREGEPDGQRWGAPR